MIIEWISLFTNYLNNDLRKMQLKFQSLVKYLVESGSKLIVSLENLKYEIQQKMLEWNKSERPLTHSSKKLNYKIKS